MRKTETLKETLMKEISAPEYIETEFLPSGKSSGLEATTDRLLILKGRLNEMEAFKRKHILMGQEYSEEPSLVNDLFGFHILPRKTYAQGYTGVIGQAPSKEVWNKIYEPLYQKRKEKLLKEIQETEKNLSVERKNLKKVI